MIIHPLAQAAIFALVLAEVMGARMPGAAAGGRFAYAMYLLSGMLAWSLFSEIVTRCLTVFIDNGNLLKKMLSFDPVGRHQSPAQLHEAIRKVIG